MLINHLLHAELFIIIYARAFKKVSHTMMDLSLGYLLIASIRARTIAAVAIVELSGDKNRDCRF